MRTISPFRYPGGKYSLRFLIKELIDRRENIEYFVEPFAGGAGISLWLLKNEIVKTVLLNDLDEMVFLIWKSILNEPEQFIEKIEQTQVNIDNWRKQKFILRDSDKDHKYSELELGFAAFFLNRCNRSGIITNSVGPIGGKNQDGKWKVDARYNKRELIQKIEILKSMKGNIVISNEDAVLMMKKIDTPISKTLIYIDPPYFQHGPQLYRCYFTKKDHLRLAEYVQNDLKYDWIVSYDDDEYIRNIYHNQNISPIILNHRAQKQHIENELIIQRP